MTPPQGLLKDRPIVIGILAFCVFESVTSWRNITRYLRFPHDPVHIFGLAFVILITASIVYRSPLFADRVLFGAATAAFVLMAVRIAPLASLSMLGVETAEALMWTVAAAVGIAVLLRVSVPHRSG